MQEFTDYPFKSVLLVDDDPTSNFLSILTLEDLHIASWIDVTYNGKEALEYITTKCADTLGSVSDCFPTLLLLDLNMPLMNGFEFLEHFTNLPSSIQNAFKVVILTSSVHEADKQKVKQYPLLGYLEKPLLETNLLSLLRMQ